MDRIVPAGGFVNDFFREFGDGDATVFIDNFNASPGGGIAGAVVAKTMAGEAGIPGHAFGDADVLDDNGGFPMDRSLLAGGE